VTVEFRILDFCYPWSLLRLRREFERSQWSSERELVLYQEERLRRVVAHAYKHVPYYRDLFQHLGLKPTAIQTLADLSRIPILSKNILRHEFPRLRAAGRSGRELRTSGTNGAPVRVLMDKSANVLEFVYYWRQFSWAGYRLGDRFAELTSHFFLKRESCADQLIHRQRLSNRLLLNSLNLGQENVRLFAGALRNYRPRFLKGIASALYYFALFLRELRVDGIALQGVFSTGEVLTRHQRSTIEGTFRCKVYDLYGHMERTVAVSECPKGNMHIHPEYGILELTGKIPVGPASPSGDQIYQARVVGTSLHNFCMPLLRYDVGDIVEVADPQSPCPCGRRMPRLHRILGRQEDVVIRPDGHVVTALFIVFDQVPEVAQGQIVQTDNDRLCIRVVRNPQYTLESEAELLSCLRRFVGPDMAIELEYLPPGAFHEEMWAGKFRMVVSRLRQPTDVRVDREHVHHMAGG
jgi:phenylacetate-CoA ligase